MKAQEFCYWLQGMFELSDVKMLNAVQLETVRKHLQMVIMSYQIFHYLKIQVN
jgi:hypothetical protein